MEERRVPEGTESSEGSPFSSLTGGLRLSEHQKETVKPRHLRSRDRYSTLFVNRRTLKALETSTESLSTKWYDRASITYHEIATRRAHT